MSNPTDVLNNGTAVDAAFFYSGADSLSINGVTFNTLPNTDNVHFTDSTGDISITLGSGGLQGGTDFASGGSTPDSTNYDDLASKFGYGTTTADLVTLSGLTALQTYQVEVWASASAFPGLDATTLTGATPVTLVPEDNEYAVGTFVASSGSETFGFDKNVDYGFINAVSVRAIPALDVPEPGTWALLVGGVALLAVMRWKRSLAL